MTMRRGRWTDPTVPYGAEPLPKPGESLTGNGGQHAMAALAAYGVEEVFTLSGAQIWPVYDACVKGDLAIYDTRHEQTAGFAAEAMAKLTRRPAVAAVTAGPGVTNVVSAVTTAHMAGTPLVVLGGRAPQARWGSGSLQELDHVPILAPITKDSRTAFATADMGAEVGAAVAAAATPHRGPVFVDFPMDTFFAPAEATVPVPVDGRGAEPDPDDVRRAAELLAGAERPMLVCGGDVWWNHAEEALVRLVEELRIPTFVNGLGRGCIPADHELAFSRTRSKLHEADVVVVVGTPLDFRLSFGSFGTAKVVHVVDHTDRRAGHVAAAVSPAGDLRTILDGMAAHGGSFAGRRDHEPWIASLRDLESERAAKEDVELAADGDPIHPARVYGELRKRLDRDAVVVCDGGDFVSYAGKYVPSYQPGLWLDPGPFGCLGTGMGALLAGRVAHPDRQVVALLGDGGFGFGGLDVDTLVRHDLPVVMVVGNNGIWGLEKHPMKMIYGWDVAADLRQDTGYDAIVRALGGAGETVTTPADLGAALDRAFAAGVPYLVNVLTDPSIAYPRSSNLA